MTPNLTLDQIIEKALPAKNITCAIDRRLKIQCQKELKEYIEDWHKRENEAHAANEALQRVY